MVRHENFAEKTTLDRGLAKIMLVTAHILADVWQILIK